VSDDLQTLAQRVRFSRLRRGWSQAFLANEAELSPQTISNVEADYTFPQVRTIINLAEALDTTPEYLINGDNKDWHADLALLEQRKIGARWVEQDGRLRIDPSGSETDLGVARDTLVRQLHEAVIRKAIAFADIAIRLDNATGWQGIAAASRRFSDGVKGPTEEIPEHLGKIYDAILELGSFLEQDLRLQRDPLQSADPLDPDVHRALSDLIRTAAPWLRRFPTIRELDDETAAFLTRRDLLSPATEIIEAANAEKLVSSADKDIVVALVQAAERSSEFQGQKAATRSVHTVRNLVYASASAVALFLSGAVASDFSTKSALIEHAGSFLAAAEEQITHLAADLPGDIRIAFSKLLEEIKRLRSP